MKYIASSKEAAKKYAREFRERSEIMSNSYKCESCEDTYVSARGLEDHNAINHAERSEMAYTPGRAREAIRRLKP